MAEGGQRNPRGGTQRGQRSKSGRFLSRGEVWRGQGPAGNPEWTRLGMDRGTSRCRRTLGAGPPYMAARGSLRTPGYMGPALRPSRRDDERKWRAPRAGFPHEERFPHAGTRAPEPRTDCVDPASRTDDAGSHGSEQRSDSPADLADWLYAASLCRKPSPDERAVALEMLGPKPDAAGIQDLLWAIFMLPEFQLVR